ncbi:MAG: phosphate acyltransferase PlsX [Actinobacteria bacterium]|nr:MAG: phosphate acyltransferase PlsX [Actinomycetota bacterium]
MGTTIAIDAMGGDRAPGEIVAGALLAVEELGIDALLVGREEIVREHLPGGDTPPAVKLLDAREVIAMDDDPARSVRTRKDASVVRCANAVRDGDASAMVSAGNTGAAMAAALLRLGRIRGVARPAIAVPIPVPGDHHQLLVDAGATVDATADWLVQFARMGRAYAQLRYGLAEATVGLLSNGEEAGKGDELRKQAAALLEAVPGYVGNVEGRDFMHSGRADVIVTDGFTGNVVLKTIEGALRSLAGLVFTVLESTPETRDASKVVTPLLLDAANVFDPDLTGGGLLLGVNGVCVISHGSSSARAIVCAAKVALDAVEGNAVDRIKEAVVDAG